MAASRRKSPVLILASASPRRRQLLRKIGRPFRVVASRVSEDCAARDPRKLVETLALRKARAVAEKRRHGWILGADTIVVLGRKVFGKPVNAQDASRMLQKLAGTTHRVLTGVALVDAESGFSVVRAAVSRVYMRKLDFDEVLKYSRRHMDKAGGYAIQERHDPVAKVVQGSYDNVVGLPVDLVRKMLRAFSPVENG